MRNRYFSLYDFFGASVVVFYVGHESGLRWFDDGNTGCVDWKFRHMKRLGATEITRSEARWLLGYPVY